MRRAAVISGVLGCILGFCSGCLATWDGIRSANWGGSRDLPILLLGAVVIVLSWAALFAIRNAESHPGIASAVLGTAGMACFALCVYITIEEMAAYPGMVFDGPWLLLVIAGVLLVSSGMLVLLREARKRVAIADRSVVE
jgi:hypothetical protein